MSKQDLLDKLKELAGPDAKIELYYHVDNNGLISFQGFIKEKK